MPILKKAKCVCVLTVTNEKAIDTRRSGAELAKHLARHGIDVVLDEVDAKGSGIGDVFEAREFVLGGATKSMLSRPPVPILMSH